MAQTEADIFEVTLELKARVSLDWERIMTDPLWKQVCLGYEWELATYPEKARAMLLEKYLTYYLTRDRLLQNMPSTNGPGSIHAFEMRIM